MRRHSWLHPLRIRAADRWRESHRCPSSGGRGRRAPSGSPRWVPGPLRQALGLLTRAGDRDRRRALPRIRQPHERPAVLHGPVGSRSRGAGVRAIHGGRPGLRAGTPARAHARTRRRKHRASARAAAAQAAHGRGRDRPRGDRGGAPPLRRRRVQPAAHRCERRPRLRRAGERALGPHLAGRLRRGLHPLPADHRRVLPRGRAAAHTGRSRGRELLEHPPRRAARAAPDAARGLPCAPRLRRTHVGQRDRRGHTRSRGLVPRESPRRGGRDRASARLPLRLSRRPEPVRPARELRSRRRPRSSSTEGTTSTTRCAGPGDARRSGWRGPGRLRAGGCAAAGGCRC